MSLQMSRSAGWEPFSPFLGSKWHTGNQRRRWATSPQRCAAGPTAGKPRTAYTVLTATWWTQMSEKSKNRTGYREMARALL